MRFFSGDGSKNAGLVARLIRDFGSGWNFTDTDFKIGLGTHDYERKLLGVSKPLTAETLFPAFVYSICYGWLISKKGLTTALNSVVQDMSSKQSLKSISDYQLTDKDVDKGLQWEINRVTPRRGELENLGLIVSSGYLVQANNRRAHTWRIKQ